MATLRELLDAGFVTPPESAEDEDQAIQWALALYAALGRSVPTLFGTFLALEPVIEAANVVGDVVKIPRCTPTAVQVTGGGSLGPYALRLVGAPAAGEVLVELDGLETKLSFNAGDAVTNISYMCVRAPAELVAALEGEFAPPEE